EHVTQPRRINQVLRADAVMGARDPIAEGVVLIGPRPLGRGYAEQLALVVILVAVAVAVVGSQVAVGVIGQVSAADRHVLIQRIGGVGGRHAVVGNNLPVAGGVVGVSDGSAAGQSDGSEPVRRIVAVGRRPLQGGHAVAAAEEVVGVIEPRQN